MLRKNTHASSKPVLPALFNLLFNGVHRNNCLTQIKWISRQTLRADTDVEHGHEEVRNHADVCPLLLLRLSGGPVQSVQDVLAE